MNGGQPPWSRLEHLIADCWVVLVKIMAPKSRVSDHPQRAEMEAKARLDAKSARVAELKATYRTRKRKYGLG